MPLEICSKSNCTACQACVQVCPLHCISMRQDETVALYPAIDQRKCIECGKCLKSCPVNNPQSLSLAETVYAAWSNDPDFQKNSASGGIAAELYRYCLENNGYSFGVQADVEKGAFFIPVEAMEDIRKVRNSKYVYSDVKESYKIAKEKLEHGQFVLFIGLPCQVAGLKSYLNKEYENLVTVDLICHGVVPAEYLKQHIQHIGKKYHADITDYVFRDPAKGTLGYFFSLRAKEKLIYSKWVYEDDVYQQGFHRALIYRENCYFCKYAQAARVGDLTIGDFDGLGRCTPCDCDREHVSCVLVNTEKGKFLLNKIRARITMIERDPEEAFEYEPLLRCPAPKHPQRDLFIELYKKDHNFEFAASLALKREITMYKRSKSLLRKFIRRAISMLPQRTQRYIQFLHQNKS